MACSYLVKVEFFLFGSLVSLIQNAAQHFLSGVSVCGEKSIAYKKYFSIICIRTLKI